MAAYGLHGALLVGPRHPVTGRLAEWQHSLSSFEIELSRNGVVVDRGRASNVLDGPVQALRHLVEVLNADNASPPLAAGDMVTTGTLTRAFPVTAGETWTTRLLGVGLQEARVRFA